MTTIVLDRYYGENAMQYEKRVDKLIAKGTYRGKGSDVKKIIGSQKVHTLDGALIKASVDLESKGWY